MIHRTYRRLDEPPKLGWLSIGQWIVFGVITIAIYGLSQILSLNTEDTVCVWLVAVGVPVMLWLVSEGDRPPYSRLARDLVRWLLSPKHLDTGPGRPRPLTLRVDETDRGGEEQPALEAGENHPNHPELTR
jgi:hypothetical protein